MMWLRNVFKAALFLPVAVLATSDIIPPAASVTRVSSTTVYHRVLDPASTPSKWVTRGQMGVFSDGTLVIDDSARDKGIVEFKQPSENAWYQVALDIDDEDDVDSIARAGMSSIRLCHLNSVSNLTLTVRLTSIATPKPKSIQLSIPKFTKVPKDGRCAGSYKSNEIPRPTLDLVSATPEFIAPISADLVSAPTTPTIDPQTGKPKAAVVPEKTFFQKYWMYLFGAMMAFALMSGEPEKPAAGKAK